MSSVTVQPPAGPGGLPTSDEGLPLPPIETERPGGDGPEGGLTAEFVADPSFFRWLKGAWTLDAERSDLPNKDMLLQSDPITMSITEEGGFVIDAPRIVVSSPLGEFVADLGLTGRMEIAGPLDPEQRVPMRLLDLQFTRRDLDTSGFNLPFDVSFLANGIFDALTSHLATEGLLSVATESALDVIKLGNGQHSAALTRLKLDCKVEDISFLGRHAAMQYPGPPPHSYKDPGLMPLSAPEWIAGSANEAVSYTKDATVELEVRVRVSPPGQSYKLYGINKKTMAMNFESPVLVSTGAAQTVALKARGKLPDAPTNLSADVVWNVQTVDDERWFWAGKSGPHVIFVTWAEPIVKTTYYHADQPKWGTNQCTPKRLAFATAMLHEDRSVHEIAAILQAQILDYANPVTGFKPIAAGHPAKVDTYKADVAWALLDDDNTSTYGNCGEHTALMEMCLGLLGIPSTQTHVFASSKIEVLRAGENVHRGAATGALDGKGPETRDCPHHPDKPEQLCMSFNTNPGKDDTYRVNWGEGCVEVEGVLYGGLMTDQFRAEEGRTASHNALLQLEKQHNGKGGDILFQVWAPISGGPNDVCKFATQDPKNPLIQKPAGVYVPK